MKSIKLFGRVASFAKAIQENLFGFKPIEAPKTPQMPKMPKIDHPSLFDEPQEGTVKQFGQNDIRRLETTKSGVKRYVNADQTDMFSQPAEEKQPEPEVTTPEPEPEAEPAKEETLDEMVKRILDEKQKGRKFSDVNDRVGGSKKEMAAIRKLAASELLKQDSVTQYQTIVKEKVLNPFDPIAHKDAGESPGLVFLKLKLRQALGNKPQNDDAARKLYVEEMPKTLQRIEDAKSYKEIAQIAAETFDTYVTWSGGKRTEVGLYSDEYIAKNLSHGNLNTFEKANLPSAESVYGNRFLNMLLMLTPAGKGAWEAAIDKDPVTEETIQAKYRSHIQNLKQRIEAEQRTISNLKDHGVIDWVRNYYSDLPIGQLLGIYQGHFNESGQYEGSQSVNPKYQKLYDQFYKDNKFRDHFKKNKYAKGKLIEHILKGMTSEEHNDFIARAKDYLHRRAEWNYAAKPYEEYRKKFELKEADWSFIKTDTEGTAADKNTEAETEKPKNDAKFDLRIHQNPPLQNIIRRGGEPVSDEDIKTENIINDLGFKSVQFGNYVKDIDAKEHVKNFIGAIKDLGEALDLDIKELNKLGGISLSFGARGSGRASAHYEPMRKIINLTKTNGDGSVSHEWGHYIDHVIGGATEGLEKQKGLLTVEIDKMKRAKKYSEKIDARDKFSKFSRVEQAAFNILKKIENQGGFETERTVHPPEGEFNYSFGSIKAAYKGDQVFSGSRPVRLNTPEEKLNWSINFIKNYVRESDKEKAFTYLAKLEGKPITYTETVQRTRFYDSSLGGGDYWSRPQELFARAFEAYVQDKLESKGMFNNYLVSGNRIGGEAPKYIPRLLELTYPQGTERANINMAFDELIDAIREQYQKKEPTMKSVPTIIIPFRNRLFKAIKPKTQQENFFGFQPMSKPKLPGTKYSPEFKAETPSVGTVKEFKPGDKRILEYSENGKVRRWRDYEAEKNFQYDMFGKNPYNDDPEPVASEKPTEKPTAPEPVQGVLFGAESRNKQEEPDEPKQETTKTEQAERFFNEEELSGYARKKNELINKFAEQSGEAILEDELDAYKERHGGELPSEEGIAKAKQTIKERGIKQFNNLADYIENRDYKKLFSILSSIENRFSRRFFQEYTGVTLPKTQKELSKILANITGYDLDAERMKEEAERAKQEKDHIAKEEERKKAQKKANLTEKYYKDGGVTRTAKEFVEHLIDKKGCIPIELSDTQKVGAKKFRHGLLNSNATINIVTKNEYEYAVEYYSSKERELIPKSLIDKTERGWGCKVILPSGAESIEDIAKSVNTHPTQAQIEAGNYKKEHIRLYGMEISIENPKGSTRSGVDPNGEKWSVKMKNDYGYIKGTVGKDKDHVDCFIGDDKNSETVYVINQIDPKTENFDEHKCMLGFPDKESAIAAYKSNYNDSARVNRIGSVKEMDIDEFKGWVYKPKKTKEIAKSVQTQTAQRTKLVFGRRMNRA